MHLQNVDIPRLRQKPKILVVYDSEVIRDLVAEFSPFFGDGFSKEGEDCVGELFLPWVVTVMRNVLVHDRPEALNGVEMGTVGR